MTDSEYRIAVIPGDGIGREVVPAAQETLEAVGQRFGFRCEWTMFDWSCELYVRTGSMTGQGAVADLAGFDAIFLGAIGYPGVPDHVSLWGLLIPIRRQFRQYVNLRPVRLFPGVRTPLADRGPADIDFLIVRENNEGDYSEIGGRLYEGTPDELAVQQAVFTRVGVDRVLRYAFERARAAETASDVGDQVQRHHPHHAVLGRAVPGDGGRLSRRSDGPVPHRHSHGASRAAP